MRFGNQSDLVVIRGSHPNFQGLAAANCRPMLQAMTDKCPGSPVKVQDEHACSLYAAKSTFSAEQRLLYALFFVLYLLFSMSVQD